MQRAIRIGAIVVVLCLAGLAGCKGATGEDGWLMGHVSIGPVQPVEQAGAPEPTPDPAIYAARQVVVFSADGEREVLRAGLDTTGGYRVALPPGSYVVDINREGADTASGLPVEIEILAGQETRVDIAIDTGIR